MATYTTVGYFYDKNETTFDFINSTRNSSYFLDETDKSGIVSLTIIVLILSLITLSAIFGNTLVIVTILHSKRLKTVTNYFIFSLAVADLLVSLFVMPLALTYLVTNKWLLGSILCDMWISVDVLLCTLSILNLCCISLDRYFAITQPLKYSTKRTKKLAMVMVTVAWVISVIITLPPLFGLKDASHGSDPDVCEYNGNPGYVIYSSCGSFYIPLFIMLYVYYRIFKVANEREKTLMKVMNRKVMHDISYDSEDLRTVRLSSLPVDSHAYNYHRGDSSKNGCCKLSPSNNSEHSYKLRKTSMESNSSCSDVTVKDYQLPLGSRAGDRSSSGNHIPQTQAIRLIQQKSLNVKTEMSVGSVADTELTDAPHKLDKPTRPKRLFVKSPIATKAASRASCAGRCEHTYRVSYPCIRHQKRSTVGKSKECSNLQRERKAAKTLAIVVGAFIFCWLPFFLVYVISPLCSACDVSPASTVYIVFVWLGYCNSAANPLIYACFNTELRRAFKRLLCPQHNKNHKKIPFLKS